MRVGVVILPQFPVGELRRRWASLEERGFAHGWTYDHLAWRMLADEPWYSTTITLAAAAQATSRLRLGTWVASPNFRHPVTFAKDLLSLDDVSGGRIVAAIGAGGLGWDSAVLGRPDLPPRQRVDRLAEFVELTDLLLRQGETTWHGEYWTAERARMHPAGSRERIGLVVAGNGTRSVRLAARYDGWATIGPQGHDDTDSWWAAVGELVATHRTAREAQGLDPDGADRYVDADSVPGFSIDHPGAFDEVVDQARGLGFTDVIVHWPRPADVYVGREESLDRIAARLHDGIWQG
ncbi:LLM class flavin-dependent oxidoreductase [Nakamurella endophytica]|uniref:Luciferase n=1 Tax=Nakamurella endophytica TaxID=1748367 RepID=A0A917TBP0_9ACTN|nr:LLM class flavin-dependent oxidoreductase [Nakamurella endophytica]GGM17709.1 luciferase [Nakamurella endophytica]